MGVSRSGFAALVNAVWSFLPVTSRTVHLGTASPGVIKNIQRGTIQLTTTTLVNTFTLSPAVNSGKTRVDKLGVRSIADMSGSMANSLITVDITGGGVTVQAERGFGSVTMHAAWQTVEEN